MMEYTSSAEEDKAAIRQGSQRRGVLSSVASMPFNLVQGTVGLAKGRLAADRLGKSHPNLYVCLCASVRASWRQMA